MLIYERWSEIRGGMWSVECASQVRHRAEPGVPMAQVYGLHRVNSDVHGEALFVA